MEQGLQPSTYSMLPIAQQTSTTMDVYNLSMKAFTRQPSSLVKHYFGFFAFLFVAAGLKTTHLLVRIPYTTPVFLLTTVIFVVVFKAKGGINSYIFRRCHVEIIVFSVGTFRRLSPSHASHPVAHCGQVVPATSRTARVPHEEEDDDENHSQEYLKRKLGQAEPQAYH